LSTPPFLAPLDSGAITAITKLNMRMTTTLLLLTPRTLSPIRSGALLAAIARTGIGHGREVTP
jgi:hypothetical protein